MRIDAAVLNEPGAIEVTSLSLDEPRDDEVLVDIAAAGVCHSDYDQSVGGTDGPCPMVLGHEGAGVVEATGEDVTGVERGDHVVLAVMPFCGMCRHCESGRPYLCERGNDVAFAGTMMDGTRRLSDDGR